MLIISSLKVGDLFRLVQTSNRVYIVVPPSKEGLMANVPSARLCGSQRVYTFAGHTPVYKVN